uniref:Serine hydrolase like 2 n=1 Tax=Coturnix japonica TaxID=93934 RepID=A0A8C2TD62_COTJA
MFLEVKFPVPWGHVAAKAWGPPEGHPVLCLHGWLDNANTFDRLIPLLPRDCRYVAMDFSGHGLSSHRPAGSLYHFLDYVSDVRRVVAASCSSLKQLESLLSPCHAIFASLPPFFSAAQCLCHVSLRLLEANRHLTAEGGAILLQRGATETPTGKGLLGEGAHLRSDPAPGVGREQCQQPLSSTVQSALDIQLVEVPGSHFVHLNEPEVVSGIISNFLTAQHTRARL